MSIFLLTLHLLVADTTGDVPPYSINNAPLKFEWKKFETPVSKQYRDSMVDIFKVAYEEQVNDQYLHSKNFDSSFHFVNLNDDRFPDVIYEGWNGGEGTEVDIYIHRQFMMEKVFTGFTNVVDWTFVNKRLNNLILMYYGCCADYMQFEVNYRVDGDFKFTCTKQTAILEGMDDYIRKNLNAGDYFERPIRFKTSIQDYSLRYTPEISDKDIYLIDAVAKGNIIARYPQGASGTAWAYKKDATGREWWLVEMDPQTNLSFSVFYYDLNDRPTNYVGWMSNRFLEKIP